MAAENLTLISRKQAIALGLKKYFIGKLCRNGHLSERYVAGWQCVQCQRDAEKRWYPYRKESTKQKKRVSVKAYVERHKEKVLTAKRAEHFRNRDRDLAAFKKYAKANPVKFRAKAAKREALKRMANLVCVNFTEHDVSNIFKMQNGKCGYCRKKLVRYHIDHIVALSKGGSNDRRKYSITMWTMQFEQKGKRPN